jgi:hypothetical protein
MILVALCLALVLLAGCEAAPTPFPVDTPPTPTSLAPDASSADVPPIRYALAPPGTARGIGDLAVLGAAGAGVYALTEPPIVADLGAAYDLVAGYGPPGVDASGLDWLASPVSPTVGLVIAGDRPPFDDPALRVLLLNAVDSAALAEALSAEGFAGVEIVPNRLDAPTPDAIRVALANAGLPDGVALALGEAFVPGGEAVVAGLFAAGFEASLAALSANEIGPALDAGRVQAALVTWPGDDAGAGEAAWRARFGDDAVRPLFTVPIRYRLADGLDLTLDFTTGGWPLPVR